MSKKEEQIDIKEGYPPVKLPLVPDKQSDAGYAPSKPPKEPPPDKPPKK